MQVAEKGSIHQLVTSSLSNNFLKTSSKHNPCASLRWNAPMVGVLPPGSCYRMKEHVCFFSSGPQAKL